jgi:hypothetical protein
MFVNHPPMHPDVLRDATEVTAEIEAAKPVSKP